MKEWVALVDRLDDGWSSLATKARAFVAGQAR